MTKAERHRRDEQCLQAYQKEQDKQGNALPFGEPYAAIFPPEAQKYRNPERPGFYKCVVRHEPAGEDKFWCSEMICYWDGSDWNREDGGPLRHGVQKWKAL
jgi:hypothetical protein